MNANLQAKFDKARENNGSTDTYEYVELFSQYAAQCSHVTEFGVRDCTSTWGFLAGLPKEMHSYDVIRSSILDELEPIAKDNGINFTFHKENVLENDIAETDLLFIDTQHTYKQVAGELTRHAKKVRKWILFHDTTLFGEVGDDGSAGLNQGINEFLVANPEWKLKEKLESKWGLTIIERTIP